ncbi:hypothetical protein NHX12_021258 [Muraenolepis orangiensis]|uniref:Acyl-CoA-binding domain-containing protein 5 n=1 Tax=Muraenolepis orangiensis TaxID=630683 RepID=A0A9Q0EPR0_9TELE|nr:hypothetical protein NHX12_021258 [Muraenolepis orangiensis]
MPITDEVEELLRVMGPFYELVDEKKRITQISELSSGFGTMLSSRPSKSVTKSIIRNMQLNGSLESRPTGARPQANGGPHLTNGAQSKTSLNGHGSPRGAGLDNGHAHPDPSEEPSSPQLASDSDSEVYCDSVDQFCLKEGSDRSCSLEDLDEDEDQGSLPPTLEEESQQPPPLGEIPGPGGGVQRGGEEVEASRGTSQRRRLNGDRAGRSLVRGVRGSRPSDGAGSERLGAGSWQGGEGDGERWGGAGTPVGSLNQQIVVALARLQEDMQSVLQRLHTLEALGATQARSMAMSSLASPRVNKARKNPSWWPFDVSPGTVAFAVVWPLVVQWLLRLYFQRRRR